MSTIISAEALSQYLPFWDKLTNNQQNLILTNTLVQHYNRGSLMHRGDEECVGVLLVKSGLLRIYMLSEDGREITLYRLAANDVCILSASCVLDSITFEVMIEAQSDTDVYLITSSIFKEIADQNIYASEFGYHLATTRFSDVMWSMQQLLFHRVDQRIATVLWDAMIKNNTNAIALTHEQLAKDIGSAREVVSRILKDMANNQIVELKRGYIIILDKKQLKQLTK